MFSRYPRHCSAFCIWASSCVYFFFSAFSNQGWEKNEWRKLWYAGRGTLQTRISPRYRFNIYSYERTLVACTKLLFAVIFLPSLRPSRVLSFVLVPCVVRAVYLTLTRCHSRANPCPDARSCISSSSFAVARRIVGKLIVAAMEVCCEIEYLYVVPCTCMKFGTSVLTLFIRV